MKVISYTAATITVEVDGKKILCDPWLYPGAFYNSWYQYPPFTFDSTEFDDIDYIYISHTHEDHLCKQSLESLRKDIPVLIAKFKSPFMKRIIERQGFKTIEVEHGKKFDLTDKAHFKVFLAEECSPSHEGKQTAIDTFCLINDGDKTFLNTNDNFIENIGDELSKIKKEYGSIDFLANVYTSASCYPQTTFFSDQNDLIKEKNRVKSWCYDRSASLIKLLNPKFYMPFAGHYLLAGKLSTLNKNKANTCPYEAKQYFEKTYPFMLKDNKCVVLNRGEFFDLDKETQSKEYTHYDEKEKEKYINEVLSKVAFSYEKEPMPSKKEILLEAISLIDRAYSRMEKNRQRLNFSTDTDVLISVNDEVCIKVSMNGTGCSLQPKKECLKSKNYVMLEMDTRLLLNILKGPRYAHWDNADTGSHISYTKKPNIFEKGIYHTICFFHS